MSIVYGNTVGGITGYGKTFILTDENGNELVGTVVEDLTVFDATDNDVRLGKTYVSDLGMSTGTKDIPIYRTYQSSVLVFPEESYSIVLSQYNQYDYTKFQGIIAKFNTSFTDSVCTDKVAINDSIYAVNSLESISNITKNTEIKSVDLNFVNDTEDIYVIHFFTYKEEA